MTSQVPVNKATTPAVRTEAGPFAILQRQIDRLFQDFSAGFPAFGGVLSPRIDVVETEKEIEITAELPGLEEKDVEVTVSDGVLSVRGEKKAEREQKDGDFRLVERSYGSFARSIELPAGVDPEAIKAVLEKGVLKVTMPKPAAAAPAKKIEVKAAA